MTLREKIEVMEAFERGEYVEVRTDKTVAGQWGVTIDPLWDWNNNDYRIKPKKQVVVIEKWLLKMQGTEQYAIEEGSKEEMNTWGKYKTDAWQKVKLLDTYEVEL